MKHAHIHLCAYRSLLKLVKMGEIDGLCEVCGIGMIQKLKLRAAGGVLKPQNDDLPPVE